MPENSSPRGEAHLSVVHGLGAACASVDELDVGFREIERGVETEARRAVDALDQLGRSLSVHHRNHVVCHKPTQRRLGTAGFSLVVCWGGVNVKGTICLDLR